MSDAVDYCHVSLLWAGPEHAAELAELHASLFPQAWDAAAFETLLSHPGAIAFRARLPLPQPHTIGFIVGQIAADEAEILTLGVRTDRQRHGVGRRLVDALARAARKADVRRLFLEVAGSNVPGRALYERAGFTAVGLRKDYYTHAGAPPEDALVLALKLEP